jgi:hypothetical protein
MRVTGPLGADPAACPSHPGAPAGTRNGAGDRPGYLEQRIDDAIVQAGHAPHLRLKGIEGLAEGHEHQPGLVPRRPGHGAAQHEGLGLEALLCGAFDVGGSRRVVQFVVVAAPPPDHVVLLPRPHAFKSVQVVQPLLHGHEAGAIQAGALAVGQRGLFGRRILRVLRAILIAGQVTAVAVGAAPVAKRLDRALKPQCRCQRLLDRARGMHQLAAIGATQPAPQGGGGGGHLDPGPLQGRKGAQAGHRGPQRGDHIRTDADHGMGSIDQGCQTRQGFAQGGRPA